MELCLLLLAATAVMVASSGGSPGLLPNLKCGPTTRRGRRLGRLKPVQLPSSCHQSGGSRSAALCDDPGDNYPWEAIDNYLRKSSDFVKKRVENSLKAGRISAPNALRRRRGRSSDDVISSDDVKASAGGIGDVGGEKIREKKHVNAPPARQRVTVAKTTTLPPPPPRPTVYEPELDDFAELVYATTIQRQPTEAEVPPTPARTTPLPLTTLPTPDPYTESSCQFWEEIRSPFYAMNTRNEWKTLINMPNYETFIHMEHCREEKSQGRCAEGCRCTQKYTVRTMPVYDTDANGCDVIYMDKFLFASHCDCKCLPFGYTLFRKPPLPTTPLPEVIDFVGPLPDGWLPEKPSSGRTEQEEEKEEEEGVKEPLPSSGRPDRLDLAESLPETVESQQPVDQQREEAERVKAGPAPAAATFHRPASAGVRPQRRPLGPVRRPAGPLLPQPGAPPNHRWEALARRQTDAAPAEPTAAAARPNHRNRMRGPPTAPPTYQERR